jgi:signal transduction histidine kinase/ActR/RegA family two-component response regulator
MTYTKNRAETFDLLRRRAEQLLEERSKGDSSLDSNDISELIHELEVHQAELEIQNEDLKRSQQELTSLHKEYEKLYEFAPCGYLTLNAKGIITRANLTAVSLLGVERAFLFSSTFSSFILPGWQDSYVSIRQKAGETGQRRTVELPLKTAGDSPTWVRANIHAERDETSEVVQWRIVLDDITERKFVEDELRQSRNLLVEAEKMADVGAWSWDIKNDVWSFSENWLTIHGCSEPPRTADDLLPIAHPDDLPRVREAFRMTLADKTRYDIEHRIIRQDNEAIRHVQGFGEVVTNEAGEAVRMFGASMDVTRRKQERQALEEAKEAAEKANRAKTDFLAKMSHDFRTPMNSILGMLRLAQTGDMPERQRKRLHVAKDSAESLLYLLNDLLDLSKIESGQFTLHEKEFRFRRVLKNVLHEIEPSAREKGLTTSLHVDKQIPAILIGDPYRLKQIVLNLLSNAVKFTDEGWVSLDVQQRRLDPCHEDPRLDTCTILLEVKDTGRGIGPEFMQRIFESYEQGSLDAEEANHGTGLGLAICRKLSVQMGGSVWAESEAGQGSTFYVELSFKTDGLSEEGVDEEGNPPDVQSWKDLPPLRILLVEDQKMNQHFTVDLLSSHGHQVEVAEDGKQALDMLKRKSFDLVLMDIGMPGMDGIEATRHIRMADPVLMYPDIPIIGLSAHVPDEEEQKSLRETGFNDFISKPLDFEKLFAALKDAMP